MGRESTLNDVYLLDDLAQVRVLADPLRLRVLEALCDAPRTTKQVAELLGEKPTKLYHHVDALERVGLVRLASTKPKRGTVEKYYLAVARSFRADPALFSPEGTADDGWRHAAATVLEDAAARVRDVRGERPNDDQADKARDVVVASLTIKARPARLASIAERLQALVAEIQALVEADENAADGRDGEEDEAQLTLAFFPREPS